MIKLRFKFEFFKLFLIFKYFIIVNILKLEEEINLVIFLQLYGKIYFFCCNDKDF